MSEAVDIALAVGLALGVKDVIAAPGKAVGQELADRIKPRFARLLDKAHRKGMDGPVSDRVAAKALHEAAFTDDDVTLEYLAGVVAASGPDDDAGAAIVAQIGRLSAVQLRLHYIVYREVRRLWEGPDPINLSDGTQAPKGDITFDRDDLSRALSGAQHEEIGQALAALRREDLVGDFALKHVEDDAGVRYIAWARPTGMGALLFLWGQGIAHLSSIYLFADDLGIDPLADVPETPSARLQPKP
jgi:hypothetical protein